MALKSVPITKKIHLTDHCVDLIMICSTAQVVASKCRLTVNDELEKDK